MKAMVPSAAEDDCHALFATLDEKDGNGSLDMQEISNMMRKLEQRATKAKLAETDVAANVKELRKAAAAAQRVVLEELQRDEEEAARREAAEEEEAEAQAIAAAEAAQAAKAARESKVSQKAAEKAAFEAKVAARRSGRDVKLGNLEA